MNHSYLTSAVLICLIHLKLGAALLAADYLLKTEKQVPPETLADAVRSTLNDTAYTLLKGDQVVYRFWFVQSLNLQGAPESPAKGVEKLTQPALLGAVEVIKNQRDYRDDSIYHDVYTMRYGIRPDDGNHLGTSDYRHFAVLIPAEKDKTVDGISGYKPLVKASRADTASDHPVIMSLRPVPGTPAATPEIVEPAPDHLALRVKLKGQVEGAGDEHDVVLDIVFEGVAMF